MIEPSGYSTRPEQSGPVVLGIVKDRLGTLRPRGTPGRHRRSRRCAPIEAVALARGYGALTIGITAAASPLAEAVEHPLSVAIAKYPVTLTPTAARFAFLVIIDLLSTAAGYALSPAARENLRRIKYTTLNHRAGKVLEPLGD